MRRLKQIVSACLWAGKLCCMLVLVILLGWAWALMMLAKGLWHARAKQPFYQTEIKLSLSILAFYACILMMIVTVEKHLYVLLIALIFVCGHALAELGIQWAEHEDEQFGSSG